MKQTGLLTLTLATLTAIGIAIAQAPAARTTGPGVQAGNDSREPEILKTCKVPPPARGGGGAPKGGAAPKGGGAPKAAAPKGKGPAAPAGPKDYTVAAIPNVIAAGAKWTEAWEVDGNNADGIIAAKNGDILLAQNDNSNVVRLDKNGKTTVEYTGTNTGGSLTMNKNGDLFILNRGLNPSIEQLAPKRHPFATKLNDDPLDCLGVVLNDATSDKKGGVYFTAGGVFYANSKGVITRYGQNLQTNGIMLSPDEKHLFVTNAGGLTEFDVQKDGSLTNQREFAKLTGGGGDGSAFDKAGRMYVTTGQGVEVLSPEGKSLGIIPVPRSVISVTFGGPDRKMLYAVSRDNAQNKDWIIAIPMLAQGPKGRAK